jgi:hypothetical protein
VETAGIVAFYVDLCTCGVVFCGGASVFSWYNKLVALSRTMSGMNKLKIKVVNIWVSWIAEEQQLLKEACSIELLFTWTPSGNSDQN